MVHCVPCPARKRGSFKAQKAPHACADKRARPLLSMAPPVIVHCMSRAIDLNHIPFTGLVIVSHLALSAAVVVSRGNEPLAQESNPSVRIEDPVVRIWEPAKRAVLLVGGAGNTISNQDQNQRISHRGKLHTFVGIGAGFADVLEPCPLDCDWGLYAGPVGVERLVVLDAGLGGSEDGIAAAAGPGGARCRGVEVDAEADVAAL